MCTEAAALELAALESESESDLVTLSHLAPVAPQVERQP